MEILGVQTIAHKDRAESERGVNFQHVTALVLLFVGRHCGSLTCPLTLWFLRVGDTWGFGSEA